MRTIRALLLALSVHLIPGPAAAQAPAKPLDVQDIFHLQLATDPQISPDGKRVVYVRQFCDIMTDRRRSNLWVVSADGSDHRALTAGNYNDTTPRWSPDGTS